MTALFGMHMRIGGDPRPVREFKQLCCELENLDHDVCPVVDWQRVECLCLAVFKKNGIDLQTAVAFVLASGNLRGVDGLVQGFALLDGLLGRWPEIWPTVDATRLEILAWLYLHVLVVLRGLDVRPTSLSAVLQFQAQLHRMRVSLRGNAEHLPVGLRLLQQWTSGLLPELERSRLPIPGLLPAWRPDEAERAMPLFILPPPRPASLFVIQPHAGKARIALGFCIAGVLGALLGWVAR